MKVKRARNPVTGLVLYVVMDDHSRPIKPIMDFLAYLENKEYSPNTLKTYAHALANFWSYLKTRNVSDWTDIDLLVLSGFVHYLRMPTTGVEPIRGYEANRSDSTINLYISAVGSFYDFHDKMGVVKNFPMYRYTNGQHRPYKGFLYHISKTKPLSTKRVKVKQRRNLIKILTPKQVEELISACTNRRDKLLIALMADTGMRIGQALGIRLDDIRAMDNEIDIVPRTNHPHGVRAKSNDINTLHISGAVIRLLSDYLIYDYDEIESGYLFINLKKGEVGRPLSYGYVCRLVQRLRSKTGIQFHPHMLRHTHATELLRHGVDMAIVQKRLGHRSISTTINTYAHVSNDDLKREINQFNVRNGR